MQIAIANFSINFVRAENDRFTRTQNSIACLFFDAHWTVDHQWYRASPVLSLLAIVNSVHIQSQPLIAYTQAV